MEKEHVKPAYIVLSLVLIAFGVYCGIWFFRAWSFSNFNPLMLLRVGLIAVLIILPVYCGAALLLEEMKKLTRKEKKHE